MRTNSEALISTKIFSRKPILGRLKDTERAEFINWPTILYLDKKIIDLKIQTELSRFGCLMQLYGFFGTPLLLYTNGIKKFGNVILYCT